jgi:WD40 repeat protein
MQHRGEVTSVAFSQDGRLVQTASEDGTARVWEVWNPARGKSIDINDAPTHRFGVNAAVWIVSPLAGRGFLSDKGMLEVEYNGLFRIEEAGMVTQHGPPIYRNDGIRPAALTPGGDASLTYSGSLMLAQLRGVHSGQFINRHSVPIWSANFSPDGRSFVTGGQDGSIRLWNSATGKPLPKTLKYMPAPIVAVLFTHDSKRVLTVNWVEEKVLWDLESGKDIRFFLKEDKEKRISTICAASFSPNDETLALGCFDGNVHLFNGKSGESLSPPIKLESSVWAFAFTQDGKKAVIASGSRALAAGGEARLWDLASQQPTGPALIHSAAVRALGLSADGSRLITGCEDGAARIWDMAGGNLIGPPMRHEGPITTVGLSADGRIAVTGGWDNAARFWEVATGRQLGPPLHHEGPVVRVEFHPDGSRVLTASWDRSTRMWKVLSPVEGSPEQVRLWAEVSTGMQMDQYGLARALNGKEWNEKRHRLSTLGPLPMVWSDRVR